MPMSVRGRGSSRGVRSSGHRTTGAPSKPSSVSASSTPMSAPTSEAILGVSWRTLPQQLQAVTAETKSKLPVRACPALVSAAGDDDRETVNRLVLRGDIDLETR